MFKELDRLYILGFFFVCFSLRNKLIIVLMCAQENIK